MHLQEEIITKSKENPHYSAFELVENYFGPQDHNHVARFGYDMKRKDVRGPLPSKVELQAQLRAKEKENVLQHKHIDDLEDAHKREIKKFEDHMRIVVEMVMSTQPPSDTLRVVLPLDLIMTKMIRYRYCSFHCSSFCFIVLIIILPLPICETPQLKLMCTKSN